MTLSPDGRLLAGAGRDGVGLVWDTANGKPISEPLRHQGAIRCIDLSPDGRRAVTGGYDGFMRLWELPSGRLLQETKFGGFVLECRFDPHGVVAGAASLDGTAALFDLTSGGRITLAHPGPVRDLAFSPDGARVATSSWDGNVRIWSAQGTLLHTLT